MARIGFKQAKFNKIVGDKYAPLTDAKVPVFEKVVDEKFAPEFNSAELYANDALVESDYSFTKGTLSFTVADDDDVKCAELLGNTVTKDGGEVVSSIDDIAPEIGYGHIVTKLVNSVRKFKVEFFPRVKITSISTDNKTRSQSVEFGTTAIEGVVFPLDGDVNGVKAGTWEKHQTFETYEEAVAYLDGLLTPEA